MKKMIFGLLVAVCSVGCYIPRGFHVQATPIYGPVYAGDSVILNSETGREYYCSPYERMEVCVRRACIESTWGVGNCYPRMMGMGHYTIFPGYYGPAPTIQFNTTHIHRHDNNCGHRNNRRRR